MPLSEPAVDHSYAEASMFLSPLDSNSAEAALEPLVRFTTPQTTNTSSNSHPSPKVKKHLNLPKTSEEWEQANFYFETILVPAVMAASTSQEINAILCAMNILLPHLALQRLESIRERNGHSTMGR